jgi:hypothetical protein
MERSSLSYGSLGFLLGRPGFYLPAESFLGGTLEGSRFGPCPQKKTPDICSGACLTTNLLKQAAPANVSTGDSTCR